MTIKPQLGNLFHVICVGFWWRCIYLQGNQSLMQICHTCFFLFPSKNWQELLFPEASSANWAICRSTKEKLGQWIICSLSATHISKDSKNFLKKANLRKLKAILHIWMKKIIYERHTWLVSTSILLSLPASSPSIGHKQDLNKIYCRLFYLKLFFNSQR